MRANSIVYRTYCVSDNTTDITLRGVSLVWAMHVASVRFGRGSRIVVYEMVNDRRNRVAQRSPGQSWRKLRGE